MTKIKKFFVSLIKMTDLGSAIAVRLTRLTGKSSIPIHPKHLTSPNPWFLNYINKNHTVLDLGLGNGQNSIKASKIADKVVGLEINEKLINLAKFSATQAKVKNVRFLQANLEKRLPLKNGSFDRVIFIDVLEHLHKRNQILEEVKRVLKKRGIVLIGVPNSQTSWKRYQRSADVCSYSDPDHKIEFSESSIKKLLEKHHFQVIEFNYGKYDIPLRGLVDIVGALSLSFYKYINYKRQQFSNKHPQQASGFEIVAKKI